MSAHMKSKLSSLLFMLTAISIGLGAFGHGSQWSKHVLPALTGVQPEMRNLLALIWYWVSGTMLVFSILLVWIWWRIGRGDRNLLFVPWTIGAFYLIEGSYASIYLGPFFLLFIVQAVLVCTMAWILEGATRIAEAGQTG